MRHNSEINVDERCVGRLETNDLLHSIEESIRHRLAGGVRNLNIVLRDDGLVMRGCVCTYHSKQLAQHAVMEFTKVPIQANEIEVIWEHG
jgi:hypothetical protein